MLIWVIDDDKAIRDLAGRTLTDMGYETSCYADPADIDAQDDAVPAGIMIDWHLTHGTCEAALADLHQRFPQATLMLITGDSDLDILQKAMTLGVTGWWFKPAGAANLRTQIRSMFKLPAQRRSA